MQPQLSSVFIGVVLLLATQTGCVSGMIYSHTTRPLDVDFNNTPVHTGDRGDAWKTLVIPLIFVDGQVQFDWGDISVARAMAKANIATVHYADLEERSYLGLWTERWLHVYGE